MVLLEVVRMNLKVLFATRSNKKEFVGTKAGQIRIIPATFEEKILGARFRPIIKNKLFFFGNFETVDNTSPTTWTSTGSPQPSAQISAPTFQQMQDLSTFMQDKLGYTTGPWENYDGVSKSFLLKLIGTSITLINFLFVMFITILLLTN
jgi:hypothetical protein